MRYPEDYSGAKSDQHLVELWLSGRPASTQRVYRPVAEEFLAALDPECLQQATVADAIQWAENLQGKPTTISRKVSTVKSLLSFAHMTGYTVFNVGRALRCPKTPNKLHERIVDEPTVQELIQAASGGRDRAMVVFLYASGARNSELCKLRWMDIRGRRVTLQGKGAKNRTVLLPQAVIDELMALRPAGSEDADTVFRTSRGNPMTEWACWYIIRQIADEAAHQLSPHYLRHAHASHTLDNGAPIHLVQRSLGHENVATTSRYLHANPNDGASNYLNL